jgi:predicted transcriptional regulator
MPSDPITPEQSQEIVQWRDRKLSPKEIARQMGLRPAIVSEFLRSHSAMVQQERLAKGELAPLVACLINQGAKDHLLRTHRPSLGQKLFKRPDHDIQGNGMAQIIVARMERNQYLVSSILVDYWCLGVKNALFKKCDRTKYELLLTGTARAFGEELQEVSLEQVQAIVFGAVDYAAGLGFPPHPDFEAAKVYLGPRAEQLQPIEFGQSGKPFYCAGPYDNPQKVIQTLRQNVGDGNFDYMMGMG